MTNAHVPSNHTEGDQGATRLKQLSGADVGQFPRVGRVLRTRLEAGLQSKTRPTFETDPLPLKQLSGADVELLKRLLKVFGEAFDDIPTYQDAVPSDDYLRSLLGKSYFLALVALNGNEAIGGLAAYELDKFERDRREIYIYDLAVSEKYRRRRVATALIHELKRIAKERRAYVIYVQADKGDDAAVRLYESLGAKEDVFHFDIVVEGQSGG